MMDAIQWMLSKEYGFASDCGRISNSHYAAVGRCACQVVLRALTFITKERGITFANATLEIA